MTWETSEMPEPSQPVAGSLEAKIIRACKVHRLCPLTCRERDVEDLGEIASFDAHSEPEQSSLLKRIGGWLRLTPEGD